MSGGPKLLKFVLKDTNTCECHLPLMVEGTVARGFSRHVFPTGIETQVPNVIVSLDPIHVIDQFTRSERATQHFSHHKTVLSDVASPYPLHRIPKRLVRRIYSIPPHMHIPLGGVEKSPRSNLHPFPLFSLTTAQRAIPGELFTPDFCRHRISRGISRHITFWTRYRRVGKSLSFYMKDGSVFPVHLWMLRPLLILSISATFFYQAIPVALPSKPSNAHPITNLRSIVHSRSFAKGASDVNLHSAFQHLECTPIHLWMGRKVRRIPSLGLACLNSGGSTKFTGQRGNSTHKQSYVKYYGLATDLLGRVSNWQME